MARLVINPTSASKKEIRIASRVISIGRDPSNDLVLSDSMVSRRHAILEQRDDLFVLRDNHSSNGTLVNGDKVETEKALQDGDLVAIGSSRLLFQLDEGEHRPSAPSLAASQTKADVEPARSPQPSTRRCPACGEEARGRDRFCRSCGQNLDAEGVRCEACGTFVILPAEFCGQCGKSLSAWERRPQPPPIQPRRQEVPGPSSNRMVPKGERVAGLGVRLLAALVDGMILGIPLLLAALVWVTLAAPGSETPSSSSPKLLGFAGVTYVALCIGYFVLSWGLRGATLGMSLLGLIVETEEGNTPIGLPRASLRLASSLLSLLPLGLGVIRVAFREDRMALHDRLSGTRVTVRS